MLLMSSFVHLNISPLVLIHLFTDSMNVKYFSRNVFWFVSLYDLILVVSPPFNVICSSTSSFRRNCSTVNWFRIYYFSTGTLLDLFIIESVSLIFYVSGTPSLLEPYEFLVTHTNFI